MPKKRKEPVEKACEECGQTFKTRHAHRARYCSSRCRSAVWNKAHRVEDPEALRREVLREYWRAEWRRNGPARRARLRAKKAAESKP